MNKVTINGKTYTAPDNCVVSVKNNKVYFNGKPAVDFNDWKEKNIKITMEGDIHDVALDCGDIVVNCNCNNVSNTNGDIKIKGDVSGNVSNTNGDISCKEIRGNATTTCGDIVKNFTEKIFTSLFNK